VRAADIGKLLQKVERDALLVTLCALTVDLEPVVVEGIDARRGIIDNSGWPARSVVVFDGVFAMIAPD